MLIAEITFFKYLNLVGPSFVARYICGLIQLKTNLLCAHFQIFIFTYLTLIFFRLQENIELMILDWTSNHWLFKSSFMKKLQPLFKKEYQIQNWEEG